MGRSWYWSVYGLKVKDDAGAVLATGRWHPLLQQGAQGRRRSKEVTLGHTVFECLGGG